MGKSKSRDLAKESAWRRRLARHADSGQSVRAWCRRHRVKETAFHWCRRELARRDAEQPPLVRRNVDGVPHHASSTDASFVPVHLADDPAPGSDPQIEIVLMDGRRVRITGPVNREMLAEVLDVLEHRAC
jgi:hypothetical protein